jgi:hypothetical protein
VHQIDALKLNQETGIWRRAVLFFVSQNVSEAVRAEPNKMPPFYWKMGKYSITGLRIVW